MNPVLVDTSVWVEMFRNAESPATEELGRLLKAGRVCTHGLIRAEVLSGARAPRDYRLIAEAFSGLTLLADPPVLWDAVGRARYRLARRGYQAAIADLVVACVAHHHRRTLFTLDGDFRRIRDAVPLKLLEARLH